MMRAGGDIWLRYSALWKRRAFFDIDGYDPVRKDREPSEHRNSPALPFQPIRRRPAV